MVFGGLINYQPSNRKGGFILKYLIVSLVLLMGCAAQPPTVTEVPETLTISTGSGTAVLNNTDSKGGSWSQTVPFSSGVTYTMSVYPGSTGNFTVTFGSATAFNYTFGTASSTVASTTTFTSPNVNF